MPPATNPPSPVLISLPNGLDLGGVTTWAVRLVRALADLGHPCTIIAHPIPTGHTPAPPTFLNPLRTHPRITLIDADHLPSLHTAGGDLSPWLPLYRRTVERLAFVYRSPVAYFPNILGDAYGLGAAIATTHPHLLRIIAWQHTDSDYDSALIRRYAPCLAGIVAIDRSHRDRLARLHPHLASPTPSPSDRIVSIPHGVETPAAPPAARSPLPPRLHRPVHLLYTGRVEHRQKRITALAYLCDELDRRAVPHRLTLIGDGPARADFARLCIERPSIELLPACAPDELVEHYRRADAFVLPSRYEGLCISRIEAAAQGCVPIVTHDRSGAADGLADGVSAVFVPARFDDDEPTAARHLADAVQRFLAADARAMSVAAWESTRTRFSMDAHAAAVARLIRDACAAPPRIWPASRAAAFSAPATTHGLPASAGTVDGSGSLGPNAHSRLFSLLTDLAGHDAAPGASTAEPKPIALHGAGRHTIELAPVLAQSPVPIAAITDDDPSRWGSRLFGWPVVPPTDLPKLGVETVVISSYIHADSIWARRAVYENAGINVRRIYPDDPTGR
ncbi:MAG: glycosyltransferase [Phycisphaeraceae bacterium]|nr:glycosyltransferase [Phycisphaeraceae bacterium]